MISLLAPPTVEALPPESGDQRAEFAFDEDDVTQVEVPLARPAEPEADRRPKRERGRGLLIGIAAAMLLLIGGSGLAAYKLVFETKDGTLYVEIDDAATEAKFKNGELQILDAEGKVKYTLKPSDRNTKVALGDYTVRVRRTT